MSNIGIFLKKYHFQESKYVSYLSNAIDELEIFTLKCWRVKNSEIKRFLISHVIYTDEPVAFTISHFQIHTSALHHYF